MPSFFPHAWSSSAAARAHQREPCDVGLFARGVHHTHTVHTHSAHTQCTHTHTHTHCTQATQTWPECQKHDAAYGNSQKRKHASASSTACGTPTDATPLPRSKLCESNETNDTTVNVVACRQVHTVAERNVASGCRVGGAMRLCHATAVPRPHATSELRHTHAENHTQASQDPL